MTSKLRSKLTNFNYLDFLLPVNLRPAVIANKISRNLATRNGIIRPAYFLIEYLASMSVAALHAL